MLLCEKLHRDKIICRDSAGWHSLRCSRSFLWSLICINLGNGLWQSGVDMSAPWQHPWYFELFLASIMGRTGISSSAV